MHLSTLALGVLLVGAMTLPALAGDDDGALGRRGPVVANSQTGPQETAATASEAPNPKEPKTIVKRGKGRFDASIMSLRPAELAPAAPAIWPPLDAADGQVVLVPEPELGPSAPAPMLAEDFGLITRSAPPAGINAEVAARIDLTRHHTVKIVERASPERSWALAPTSSSGATPRAGTLAPPGGGRARPDTFNHQSVLARHGQIDPGPFNHSEAFMNSLGEPPVDPHDVVYRYDGAHKLAYKAAASHFRRALRDTLNEARDIDTATGGFRMLNDSERRGRAYALVAEKKYGNYFPKDLWEAMENEDGTVTRIRKYQQVGSEILIANIGPLRLRNDFRLLYDKIDLDLFETFRGDDPIEDWNAEVDELPPSERPAAADRGSSEPKRGLLDFSSRRRRLIRKGNLYTGDHLSVDGRIRLRGRGDTDIAKVIMTAPRLRLTAKIYGGSRHKQLFEIELEARMPDTDKFQVTLDIVSIGF